MSNEIYAPSLATQNCLGSKFSRTFAAFQDCSFSKDVRLIHMGVGWGKLADVTVRIVTLSNVFGCVEERAATASGFVFLQDAIYGVLEFGGVIAL